MSFLIIVFTLILLYGLLLLLIAKGMSALPETKLRQKPLTKFSVLIPFKDEAENLDLLLQSLQKLNYPSNLFEIILIDDHSTDQSVEMICSYAIEYLQIIKNDGEGKKAALQKAVTQARNEWLITTDADCQLPPDWLNAYNNAIFSNRAKMILAPVVFFDTKNFLGQLQQIEFLSLQALTMASCAWGKPFLSNGANMGFLKSAFLQVNGYAGNEHIASGDDVFLLEKFRNSFPDSIHYLKSRKALVKTQAQHTWKDLIHQKIRWAGKTKNFKSVLPILIGLGVLITHIVMLFCIFRAISDSFCIAFLILKFLFDFLYIIYVNRFFKSKILPLYFVATFWIYPLYYIVLTFLSFRNKYEWKGRKI